jgi:hypothetical protein
VKPAGASLRGLVALVALVAAGAGCKQDAVRSLLPIEVTADNLADLRSVRIVITRGTAELVNRSVDWSGSPLLVAFHLPADVEGAVSVAAEGLDAENRTITTRATAPATVTAGATASTVSLHLVRGTGPADPDAGAKADGPPVTPMTDGPPTIVPDAGAEDVPPGVDMGGTITPDAGPGRSWHPGENLQKDDLHGGIYVPDVAIDASQVLAVWAGSGVVTVRRFDAQAQTWGALTTIDSQGDPQGACIALGPNGRALVVWYQYSADGTGALRGLWESHSSDGGKTWTKAARVQMAWIFNVVLAMSASGEARLAWEVDENATGLNYPRVSLWSATYQASTGTFGSPAVVKDGGSDTTERQARIVMDGAGNGILSWQQLDEAGKESVWATGFSGTQPLAPQLLEANTTERLFDHNVAMAPEGNKGLVVWTESEGQNEWLMFDEYAAGVWKGPHRELSGASFSGASAVIDHAGVVTVAWPQPSGGDWKAAAARRTPGAGWAAPTLLEASNFSQASSNEWPEPQLAVDAAGAVQAVWRRKTSATKLGFDVVARRFAGGMWEPEVILGHKDTLRTFHPRVVAADDGRAAAAFYFFSLRDDPDTTESESNRAFVGLYR